MSATTALVQSTVATVLSAPAFAFVCALLLGTLSAALLVLFQPLLGGIARAVMLALHPHLSREERKARRTMRDALMLRGMLNACEGSSPSLAADLRALAARG